MNQPQVQPAVERLTAERCFEHAAENLRYATEVEVAREWRLLGETLLKGEQ